MKKAIILLSLAIALVLVVFQTKVLIDKDKYYKLKTLAAVKLRNTQILDAFENNFVGVLYKDQDGNQKKPITFNSFRIVCCSIMNFCPIFTKPNYWRK